MKRSPRTVVQRSRVLPARQYQCGRKFDVRSAREENHKQQVIRSSSNSSNRIQRGREPNGIAVDGRNESFMKTVILIQARRSIALRHIDIRKGGGIPVREAGDYCTKRYSGER